MRQSSSTSRGSRWIVAPLVLVLLLAIAWSGVWFYAAHRAEAAVATWLEREVQSGRVHGCGSRTVGGYPFRIEMRCKEPRAEVRGGGEPTVLRARELLAVAQIYQPDLVIAEVYGPLTIASGQGPATHTADWTLLQVSVRGFLGAPERVSLVLDAPKLQRADMPVGEMLASARRLEFHARRNAEADRANPVFDLVARASAATLPPAPALAARPIDMDATGVVRGLKDFEPKPFKERLREWQAAGGKLEITQSRVAQGDIVAVAKGQLGLNAQARIDGTIEITLAGLEQIVGLIFGSGQSRMQAGVLTGLSILGGRQELEGKRAVNVPLRFRDGSVFFGPVPVGQIAPIY